jgi:hypothetical protein
MPITLLTQSIYLVVKAIRVLDKWVRQTSIARRRYTKKKMADIEVWGEGKIVPINFINI